jgi:uracil-DNA glycosylase family 4
MNKKEKLDNLIEEMSNCTKCTKLTKKTKNSIIDCSLINIYKDKDMCKSIPSIWTDWYNRLDAEIMIVGQDWGPVDDMKKFYKKYKEHSGNDNIEKKATIWKQIIEEEKSLTKKMLTKYIVESAKLNNIFIDNDYLDKIYITNAIMCGRRGKNYRDAKNFSVKECTINCMEYLKHQIDIVNPKIILTLGYYPLLSLSKIYQFEIDNTLTKTINNMPELHINNIKIIPLFHPASQIKGSAQLKQYSKIWDK